MNEQMLKFLPTRGLGAKRKNSRNKTTTGFVLKNWPCNSALPPVRDSGRTWAMPYQTALPTT